MNNEQSPRPCGRERTGVTGMENKDAPAGYLRLEVGEVIHDGDLWGGREWGVGVAHANAVGSRVRRGEIYYRPMTPVAPSNTTTPHQEEKGQGTMTRPILEVMGWLGAIKSYAEGRRLIACGAVKVDGYPVTDHKTFILANDKELLCGKNLYLIKNGPATPKAPDLLPCPCGKPGRLLRDESSDYESHWTWVAECFDSSCGWSYGHCLTEADAILAWNRRPLTAEPKPTTAPKAPKTAREPQGDGAKGEVSPGVELRKAVSQALECWNTWMADDVINPSEDWLDAMSDLEIAFAKATPPQAGGEG